MHLIAYHTKNTVLQMHRRDLVRVMINRPPAQEMIDGSLLSFNSWPFP